MNNQSLLNFCKEYRAYADLEVEKLIKKIEEFKPFIISMDLLLKLLNDLESIESVYEKIDNVNKNKLNNKFTEFQKGLDAGRHQILSDINILINKYKTIKDLDKLKKEGCIFCDQEDDDINNELNELYDNKNYNQEDLIKDWWGNSDDEEINYGDEENIYENEENINLDDEETIE